MADSRAAPSVRWFRSLLACLMGMLLVPLAFAGEPGGGQELRLGTVENPSNLQIEVARRNAVVLRFDQPIEEVLVGSSDVADVLPLTDHSIYVLGKTIGSTSLTILDAERQMIGLVNLFVTVDLLPIKMHLFNQFPNERIEVRSVGRNVMLSGAVTNSAISTTARDIAASYAPGSILNALDIRQPQQVMLAVRVAEIQRTASQALGLSINAAFNPGDTEDGFISNILDLDNAARLLLGINDASLTIDFILDALEEQGAATILAEPTLMALSGQTATFLAGGEFPVPVGRRNVNDTQVNIEIEFKEFGVRLGFTPTVIGDTINLVVEPEVSQIDRQNGINLGELVIPGISTRRVTTTVELSHGQSFAIAGLISQSYSDDINQIPGFSNIPILGMIGRSTNYQQSETELVIIVTPYLVTPGAPGDFHHPVENFVRPTTLELFFMGHIAGSVSANSVWASQQGGQHMAQASGLDGAVGYVLE